MRAVRLKFLSTETSMCICGTCKSQCLLYFDGAVDIVYLSNEAGLPRTDYISGARQEGATSNVFNSHQSKHLRSLSSSVLECGQDLFLTLRLGLR